MFVQGFCGSAAIPPVLNPAAVDINPLGAGHADAAPRAAKDVSDKAGRGRLAVDPRHGDDRDPPRFAGAEQRADNRLADRPRFSRRRLQVHPQAGGRIDLDDHAALRFQRAADVDCHDVHAGNVQPDHAGRFDRPRRDFRMDRVGHIGRGAAGALALALRRISTRASAAGIESGVNP